MPPAPSATKEHVTITMMIVAESSRAAAPLEDVVVVVVGARVVVEAAVVVELASPWLPVQLVVELVALLSGQAVTLPSVPLPDSFESLLEASRRR